MLQEVASYSHYTVYHDTTRGNYKIHDGNKIIANPSTFEDAYIKVRLFINPQQAVNHCEGCDATNCNDCERYS